MSNILNLNIEIKLFNDLYAFKKRDQETHQAEEPDCIVLFLFDRRSHIVDIAVLAHESFTLTFHHFCNN